MPHLSFEELSDFVSMDNLSGENRVLATKVLSHIRTCNICREALGGMLSVTEIFSDARRSLAEERKGQKEK